MAWCSHGVSHGMVHGGMVHGAVMAWCHGMVHVPSTCSADLFALLSTPAGFDAGPLSISAMHLAQCKLGHDPHTAPAAGMACMATLGSLLAESGASSSVS